MNEFKQVLGSFLLKFIIWYIKLIINNKTKSENIFFPNSFTPNGDGINEVYEVKGRSAKDIEYFAIYNRWGQRIFESQGNASWSGENCPTGLYTLNIFVKNNRYIRTITLVR